VSRRRPASTDPSPVPALLESAGLEVPEEELASLGRVYGAVRAQADGLYHHDFGSGPLALDFDPRGVDPLPGRPGDGSAS
jgi:hypothetical protein